MPRRSAAGGSRRPRPRARKRRFRLGRYWPSAARRRRWAGRFNRAPAGVRLVVGIALLSLSALAINWVYQVVRKPSELFFPVSGTLYKTPQETWREYGPAFRKYSTSLVAPELLAALAQVEGSGNPVARTYWRWSWRWRPFEVYRPASSAVGMYQITDGTFAQARHYCVRDHIVIEDGPWDDWRSCWLNSLYMRVVPSHAIELTAAYLDRSIAATLARHPAVALTREQIADLAAVTHLCGAGGGDAYAGRHFHLKEGERCGDHEVRVYVARVSIMSRLFRRLAESDDG